MSSITYAPASAGDFDDFRKWEVELSPALREVDAPLRPHHPSRAEQRRVADAEIAEGVAEWHRTHDRRA